MTHTQGQLDYDIDSTIIYSGNNKITKIFNPQMSNDGWRTAVSNARRMVACWNLLEGVPTEKIEASTDYGSSWGQCGQELAAMTVQRDELLTALKLATSFEEGGKQIARAAIAKAEGAA